ncbi:hypothetical protein [Alteromonas flava]|uniref:hypothetical protein n=1 Tax=Alteromonas flava TaxID=2048003 RepID=UPI000F5F20FA|nr:hypothetical protein [Alteromonas flava]
MIKLFVTLGMMALLAGCSASKQSNAQIPLVSKTELSVEAAAPSALQQLLEQPASKNTHKGGIGPSELSPVFYSARGIHCRYLKSPQDTDLYCRNSQGIWFAVPAVLSDMHMLDSYEEQ